MTRRGPYRAKPEAGSIADLVARFRKSPRFLGWAPSTRTKNDRILGDFVARNGRAQAAETMKHPTLLSLDLGTQTGWAYGPMFGQRPASGTQSFALGRFDGGGMRFLRFQRWLDEMLGDADRVVYEEVRRHLGTDAAHVYGGLQAVLTAGCEARNISYEAVPVATIKRYAVGKGNANKDQMMAAMRGRGYDPETDDEADALALWLLTACM